MRDWNWPCLRLFGGIQWLQSKPSRRHNKSKPLTWESKLNYTKNFLVQLPNANLLKMRMSSFWYSNRWDRNWCCLGLIRLLFWMSYKALDNRIWNQADCRSTFHSKQKHLHKCDITIKMIFVTVRNQLKSLQRSPYTYCSKLQIKQSHIAVNSTFYSP